MALASRRESSVSTSIGVMGRVALIPILKTFFSLLDNACTLLDLKQMYNGCLAKSQAAVATKSSGQMLHMPECFPHIQWVKTFSILENGASGASTSLFHLFLAVSQEVVDI